MPLLGLYNCRILNGSQIESCLVMKEMDVQQHMHSSVVDAEIYINNKGTITHFSHIEK